MINEKRLGDLFQTLVRIDSVSGKEGRVAREMNTMLRSLGMDVVEDGAGARVGSDTGNLIAKFEGSEKDVSPLLINAHMDTVEPGQGVQPLFSDGVFTSGGETILGADDKSALAVIVEVLRCIKEKAIPHGPIEVVLTVSEEIGLLGAKHLDYSLVSSRYGYSLDSGDVNAVVTRAPALNQVDVVVYGRAAHAGAEPEKGINAIQVAGEAVAGMILGRIDEETTANIGVVQGGRATNIVPEEVHLSGEVRSHNMEKLGEETQKIIQAFEDTVSSYRMRVPAEDGLPKCVSTVTRDFSAMHIPDDDPVVQMAGKAGANLGREIITKTSGGGSDANVFFENGIVTGVLGTGMKDVHSVRESVALRDMVLSAELLLEIIRVRAAEQ